LNYMEASNNAIYRARASPSRRGLK